MENTSNDNIEKAMTLMAQAMKQYEEGKFDLADNNRREANRLFDEASESLSTEEGLEAHMYGECRNFGLIYSVIEENAVKLYESREGQKKIGKIVSFIKDNPVLLNEFKAYNAFMNPRGVEDSKYYVDSVISVLPMYTKDTLRENNSKLLKFVKELKLNEAVDANDEKMELFENVEFALTHKENLSNVNKYMEAKSVLSEAVNANNKKKTFNDIDKTFQYRIDKMQKAYEEKLSDDEKKFLEEMANVKDMKKVYESYKKELLPMLENRMNEAEGENKIGWGQIYEEVKNGQFDEKNGLLQVAKLVQVKNNLIEE